MKCVHCGLKNPPTARYCLMCGQALAPETRVETAETSTDHEFYEDLRLLNPQSNAAVNRVEKFIFRLFGGLAWLTVAFGTFIIAFAWLDLMRNGPEEGFLDTTAYAILAYAVAAIFVAINRFVKNP